MNSKTLATIADNAALAAGRRKSARVLTFEDGISRHITLTGRQWANYDAALEAGFRPDQLAWIAYDTAKHMYDKGEASDFEEEVRKCFSQMTTHIWTRTRQGRRQNASNWETPSDPAPVSH